MAFEYDLILSNLFDMHVFRYMIFLLSGGANSASFTFQFSEYQIHVFVFTPIKDAFPKRKKSHTSIYLIKIAGFS